MPFENGHFCQKCPFSSAKKWHFGCRNIRLKGSFGAFQPFGPAGAFRAPAGQISIARFRPTYFQLCHVELESWICKKRKCPIHRYSAHNYRLKLCLSTLILGLYKMCRVGNRERLNFWRKVRVPYISQRLTSFSDAPLYVNSPDRRSESYLTSSLIQRDGRR